MSAHQESRWPRWPECLAAALLLALAMAALHHGALGVGWTFDDPAHLNFAATHTPWQYFTQRAVMLQQSYAHITPWNILFYDLGLPWAGLDAWRHHLHLLAVLWATALATWALLRRWLGNAAALVGALLFVAMPATAIVGRMLMTGHYAYGLLFSVLAIHAWATALKRSGADKQGRHATAWACLAALFYALACLCKELYAPLPAVLMCMPVLGLPLARRLLLLTPVVLVAAVYVVLRLWLFGGGGMGGHASLALGLSPMAALPAALGQVREMLWGLGWAGWGGLAATAGIIIIGVYRGRATRRGAGQAAWLMAGGALAIMLPVAPLAIAGELGFGHHRLILVLAWALAIGLAWPLQNGGRLGWLLAASLLALLIAQQRQGAAFVDAYSRPLSSQYAFLQDATSEDALIPRHFERVGYLLAMAGTVQARTGRPAPAVVRDEDQIAALGPEAGARAHAWAADCACLRPLGAAGYAERVQAHRDRLARGASRPLALELTLRSLGARKALNWKLESQPGAASIWFEIPDVGRLHIGSEGQFNFGVDNTLPLPDPLGLRFGVETADGALIRTPVLYLPMSGAHTLRWQAGAQPSVVPVQASAAAGLR